MAMTTNISMRVNARRERGGSFIGLLLVLHAADDADERHEEGDDDGSDDESQEDDHDGLQHGSEARDRVVDFVVVHFGDFQKHFRSCPVSSPTSIMLMTMGGKTPLASSGWTMDSPSLTASCTLVIAPAMTTLPAVSLVMLRAWRIGTPLVTSVPSVRVKREMALFLVRSPRERGFQLHVVEEDSALRGLAEHVVADHEDDDAADDRNEVVLHGLARGDDELREDRKRLAGEHVVEDLLELRNDEHKQEAEDDDGDEQRR